MCAITEDHVVVESDTHKPELLSCGHRFHRGCIEDWLTRKNECPACRRPRPREFDDRPLDEPRCADSANASGSTQLPPAEFLPCVCTCVFVCSCRTDVASCAPILFALLYSRSLSISLDYQLVRSGIVSLTDTHTYIQWVGILVVKDH